MEIVEPAFMLRSAVMAATSKNIPQYVEIAVNLGDPMFRGVYHDKKKHPGMLLLFTQTICSMCLSVQKTLA